MAESGGGERTDGLRPGAVLPVLVVAAVVGLTIGLVVGGPLGSGGGESPARVAVLDQAPRTTTVSTGPTAPVSIQITTHALVWVCLIDGRGHPVINGLNLIRDQTVGPYDGKSFDVAFGNGKVDLTVNEQPVDVPAIAAPFGYRITRDGATRLPPADQPSCT